ncbi:MAG: 3'-5' exonuclease, partial [Oscillospiraceae bacterium]|nr:3'-5' exonuclease [Oscillospiraceae bacterium]
MGLSTSFDTLVVLDTETTGISMRTDEIIELGAVRFRR